MARAINRQVGHTSRRQWALAVNWAALAAYSEEKAKRVPASTALRQAAVIAAAVPVQMEGLAAAMAGRTTSLTNDSA
jgi:hypothetical protein